MKYNAMSWTSMDCPFCGAKKGSPCVTVTGKPAREAHNDRVNRGMGAWYAHIDQMQKEKDQ